MLSPMLPVRLGYRGDFIHWEHTRTIVYLKGVLRLFV